MNSPFKRPDIDLTGMASMTAAVVAREFLLISRFIPPPPSSFWSFGLPWLTAWGSRSTKPQHTTRKPTGCASSFTSHSRPLSGVLLQVCAARFGKTSGILQLNWSLASRSDKDLRNMTEIQQCNPFNITVLSSTKVIKVKGHLSLHVFVLRLQL